MADIIPAYIHDDYEKVSDDLMWLGYSRDNKCSYVLRFNVSLAGSTKDGKRIPYHTEYRYETRKYSNVFAGNSIKRHMTYYISIESSRQDEFGNKDFIMIKAGDMIYLRRQLREIEQWFTTKSVFRENDNKLIIAGRPSISIEGLSNNKYIIFSPIIMEDRGGLIPGIRVVLDNSNTFDMTMDKFYEFYYIMDEMNMYLSASTIMAYFGRPQFGTNMWSPNDQSLLYQQMEPEEINKVEGCRKRSLGKNFFD